ncbi:MAG: pimeloyl-CoA dehydrogenase small subunit [Rhodospirillaceae bacterium]|nr:pimeloyl-CoA dehydrogenase small subunit [Rhodospirillaceae bacterium]|tara:strand:- start:727 stop:1869 length:1143 start_codon:yes stop_codon:yes gene_type:complete
MDILLNETQALLKDSAEKFIERDYSFDVRRLVSSSEEGFSRVIWNKFAELGWIGLSMPEEYGGWGGNLVDLSVLFEEIGRGLIVEPFLSTSVLGGSLINYNGSESQKKSIIPDLINGKLLLAFAFTERHSRYNLADIETTASNTGEGYIINGSKSIVIHGSTADKLIVSARISGESRDEQGISLFIVDANAEGIKRRSYQMVDGLSGAEIILDNVLIPHENIIGEAGLAYPIIEKVIDEACIAICAESVGLMSELVRATVDYLKTREQFGTKIGSFQVLQHRAVDMFNSLELSRALVYRSAETISNVDDTKNRARAASAAKVQVGRSGKLIGQQAIQLHGGMGMTDELSVSHYFKRLTMLGTLFGDTDYHLKRFVMLGEN